MQLDAKTTALILIDLQRGVLAMPLSPHSAATVYERSRRLADRFRAAGGLVVVTRNVRDFEMFRVEVLNPFKSA